MFHLLARFIFIFSAWFTLSCGAITIKCRRACKDDFEVCKRNLGQRKCVYKEDQSFYLPKRNETTAPRPDSYKAIWFIEDRRKRLSINSTWCHTGSNLAFVTGYLIIIHPHGGDQRKFWMLFNYTKKLKNEEDQLEALVCFVFIFSKPDLIRLGQSYSTTIMSIPRNHMRMNIEKRTTELCIPGCYNKEMSKLKQCIKEKEKKENKEKRRRKNSKKRKGSKKRKKDEQENNTFPQQSSLLLYMTTALVVLLIFFIVSFVIFKYVKKRRKQSCGLRRGTSQTKDTTKLLVLINTTEEDELHTQTANVLTSMLGDKHIFNLWEFSSIEQPETWTSSQLSDCRHVLFICTPNGKRRYDEFLRKQDGFVDTYVAGIHQCTTNKIRKTKITAIYFEENSSSCVPNNFPKGAKLFQIPENLEQFVKRIRSKVTISKHLGEINHLKQTVKSLRNSTTPGRSDPPNAESHQTNSVESRSLDSSSEFDGLPLSVLVEETELPSVENDSGFF